MDKLTEENYVVIAEKAIKEWVNELNNKGEKTRGNQFNGNHEKNAKQSIKKIIPKMVSTSKIRNLLAITAAIYNDVIVCQTDELSPEIVGRINYMKVRFVYEAGREPSVKKLVTQAHILEHIDEIGNSRKQYILFSRYMEALVAYRKFYGGKDE